MSKLSKNIFITSVVFVVIATVTAGIILIGSPAKERMRQLDKRRIENLQATTRMISLYWSRHKNLPPSLEELWKSPHINMYMKRTDPETGMPFEYKVVNDKNYELCAYFVHDMAEDQNAIQKDFWTHGSGRQCFQLKMEDVK